MARNRVQFQHGLPMPASRERFRTQSQYAATLEAMPGANGFCSARRSNAAHHFLRGCSQKAFQSNPYRHQPPLIADTVVQGSKLPPTVWFLAIYVVSRSKTDLSGLALTQQLGMKWVNPVLGTLKTSLFGCYHAFAFPEYATRYLAAFACRLGHRFDLTNLNRRLLVTTANCGPQARRSVRAAGLLIRNKQRHV